MSGLLPDSILDAIGEYGGAKYDHLGDVEMLHRWQLLIAAIKAWGAELEQYALRCGERKPLSDDDIEAIAMHIRPITETGQPSWEHAVARAIELAHGIKT